MRPTLYWIALSDLPSVSFMKRERAGRLAIMARPRAGDWLEDEVTGWKAEGIDAVVSLLERDEVEELSLDLEAAMCSREGIEFISFPIADRGVPASAQAAANLADLIASKLEDGEHVAIHCRAGIGRSSVMAACVMIKTGFTASHAFERISAARGVQVPDTEEQRTWVERVKASS